MQPEGCLVYLKDILVSHDDLRVSEKLLAIYGIVWGKGGWG